MTLRAPCSIVLEKRLDSIPVTVHATDVPVSLLIDSVARRMGVGMRRNGSLYFLGELKPEDRAVLVKRSPRLSSVDLQRVVQSILSIDGKAVCMEDGLAIVSDRVEVLERVNEAIDQIGQAEIAAWMVQLYLVSLNDGQLKEFGLDMTPGLDVAASVTMASMAGGSASIDLGAKLDSILRATSRTRSGSVLADPLLYLSDGQQASYRKGLTVSVPIRAVSDQGTVTTTGFQDFEVGLNVTASMRDLGNETGMLTVKLTSSAVTDDTREVPTRSGETYQSVAPVSSDGVYLLGYVRRQSIAQEASSWFRPGFKDDVTCETLMIWGRVQRISNQPADVASDVKTTRGGPLPVQLREQLPSPAQAVRDTRETRLPNGPETTRPPGLDRPAPREPSAWPGSDTPPPTPDEDGESEPFLSSG